MSNVSDEDFSETSSISGSESSAESSESFYSTAEDVEQYDDRLEPIATEEEIASYVDFLKLRFCGSPDWRKTDFSHLQRAIFYRPDFRSAVCPGVWQQ